MSDEVEVVEGQSEETGWVTETPEGGLEVETPEKESVEVEPAATDGVPETEEVPEVTETVEEPLEETPELPKKSRFQERIDDLTAQRRSAERRVAQLERQVESLHRTFASDKEPQEADFENYKDFVKATAVWAANQSKLSNASEAFQQAERESQQAYEEFQGERITEAQEKYTDFGEKVSKLGDIFTPQSEAYHALFDSDRFADVAYYLSNNLNEARRIVGLSPRAQAREITKLEIALEKTPVLPSSKKVSNAPAPIGHAKGTKEGVRKPVESMTTEEYARYRWQQKRGRR